MSGEYQTRVSESADFFGIEMVTVGGVPDGTGYREDVDGVTRWWYVRRGGTWIGSWPSYDEVVMERDAHYAQEAQGAEVDEGGVPDVQAAQEAREQTEREGRAQSAQEASRYRGPVRGRGRAKKLDLTVTSCMECPFMHHMPSDITVDNEKTYAGGYYCMHVRAGMAGGTSIVASNRMVEETKYRGVKPSFRNWLLHHEGYTIPHTCPLPDANLVKGPTGKRALDIGD